MDRQIYGQVESEPKKYLDKIKKIVHIIYEVHPMEVIREYREIDSDEIVIKVPPSFKKRAVEILVLPVENSTEKPPTRKDFRLTTYNCNGKKLDFLRADAYNDS